MGSPQPPLVMPRSDTTTAAVAASSFSKLPLDVQYVLLQHIDSFSSLHALEEALGTGTKDLIGLFRRGVYSAVARNEFAPVADALMAVRMLDTASEAATAMDKTTGSEYVPHLVEQLASPINTGPGLLEAPSTLDKLHTLNTAALGLAKRYSEIHGILPLSTDEILRFKQAIFRCATFFELYKESKVSGPISSSASPQIVDEEEEEEEERDEDFDGDEPRKISYKARTTFLARFSHQEVLEMDCVREFMHELAEMIVRMLEDEDDEEENGVLVSQEKLASTLKEFGFSSTANTQGTCACCSASVANDSNESNERHDETNIDNSNTSCTLNTPHLVDSILLLGPVQLFRLDSVIQARPRDLKLLKAIIHTLIPGLIKRRDIFWDEIMPFWRGLRGVYDPEEADTEKITKTKAAKMPTKCSSIMDVMGVRRYQYAVLDSGRLFH